MLLDPAQSPELAKLIKDQAHAFTSVSPTELAANLLQRLPPQTAPISSPLSSTTPSASSPALSASSSSPSSSASPEKKYASDKEGSEEEEVVDEDDQDVEVEYSKEEAPKEKSKKQASKKTASKKTKKKKEQMSEKEARINAKGQILNVPIITAEERSYITGLIDDGTVHPHRVGVAFKMFTCFEKVKISRERVRAVFGESEEEQLDEVFTKPHKFPRKKAPPKSKGWLSFFFVLFYTLSTLTFRDLGSLFLSLSLAPSLSLSISPDFYSQTADLQDESCWWC